MDKVFAYRNLNRKGVVWSIKSCKTNLVIDRIFEGYFKDVELKVSQAGRNRVLKENRKNVHAGVKGIRTYNEINSEKWVQVFYNPYKYKTFVMSDGTEVYKAQYAKLTENGLFVIL